MTWQPLVGQGPLIVEASQSHSDTPHSVGLLWTSVRPEAEAATWQHTTLSKDRHLCPRLDSNPQSQTLDRAATGIGVIIHYRHNHNTFTPYKKKSEHKGRPTVRYIYIILCLFQSHSNKIRYTNNTNWANPFYLPQNHDSYRGKGMEYEMSVSSLQLPFYLPLQQRFNRPLERTAGTHVVSDINKIWDISTHLIKLPRYQISRKSVHGS